MDKTVISQELRISSATKVIYGLGDFASQLVWTFVGTYLTVFYTDVIGITPAIAGSIILFARVWDGINDPMFGAIAERTKSRFGRFRPYILFGSPILVLLNVLCFTAPWMESSTLKIAWVTVTYILLGMAYTVVNLSYGALSVVMSYDPQDRIDLNSWRMIGTNVGAVVLNIIAMPALIYFSGIGDGQSYNSQGFFRVAILFSVVALPLFLLLFYKTKEVVKPVNFGQKVSLKETIKVVLTNKPLSCIFFAMLLFMTSFFGRMGIIVYYYIYIIKRFDLISILMVLPPLVTAIAIFITKNFAEKLGKKKMLIIGFIGSALSLLSIFIWGEVNEMLLIALTALYGAFNFATPLLLSSVPEAIDYAEYNTGIRADGTSYATVSLATKFGSALGVAGGLLIMGVYGYVANTEQTELAIKGINVASNLLPAVLTLLAIIPVIIYPLTREKNIEIRQTLINKRKIN